MVDGNVPPAIGGHNGCDHGNVSCAKGSGSVERICGGYRRRRAAAAAIRVISQRRRPWPGPRIIGTLLASAATGVAGRAIEQESGGVW
jgi:hypothetical protein